MRTTDKFQCLSVATLVVSLVIGFGAAAGAAYVVLQIAEAVCGLTVWWQAVCTMAAMVVAFLGVAFGEIMLFTTYVEPRVERTLEACASSWRREWWKLVAVIAMVFGAVALCSCGDPYTVEYKDVKRVNAYFNERGYVIGYGMTITPNGGEEVHLDIDKRTYTLLNGGKYDGELLDFKCRGSVYSVSVNKSHVESTRLNK